MTETLQNNTQDLIVNQVFNYWKSLLIHPAPNVFFCQKRPRFGQKMLTHGTKMTISSIKAKKLPNLAIMSLSVSKLKNQISKRMVRMNFRACKPKVTS